MKKIYSIGEMSKMVNLSVQTLRYYDQIGLFKPNYVDTKTNYRYYRESQIQYLDIIKSLKFIGVPLSSIKEAQDFSAEKLLDFMTKHDEELLHKINQLQDIRLSIAKSKNQLKEQISIPYFSEVYEKHQDEDSIVVLKQEQASPSYIDDQQFYRLYKSLEDENIMQNSRYGAMFPYKFYASIEEISYSYLYAPVLTDRTLTCLTGGIEQRIIEAGQYICIAFEANMERFIACYRNYYNSLYHYIEEKKYRVLSEVYELVMPSNFSPNREDKFIVELKVLVG